MSALTSRRDFLRTAALAAAAAASPAAVAADGKFRLRYVLSSAMYGYAPLAEVLPEVARTGSESIDIGCKVHGDQREQAAALGDEAFAALLKKHDVRLGVSTRYPLGPFKLQDEMAWVRKHGGTTLVCGSTGPKNPSGAAARAAIAKFLEEMKPHAAKAEELGLRIAIENHSNQALHHPDSIRAFAELNKSPALGVAFAPHHLHEWADQIPALLRDLGAKNLPFVYFQEHSEGISKKASKEEELRQMPGRGKLDYRPIVKALRDIRFDGLVELFMHPTPRGIPVL
ncbi:MAG: sugar phosphate isomerase/epimerase family protein, partial [Verrucomicrobiota bacterium]